MNTTPQTQNKAQARKRLSANFLALVIMRGLDFLLPLITLPYLVATIGLERFGLINFAMSLALYFGAVVQYGFSTTATREVSRHRDDHPTLERIYSQTWWAALFLALGCCTVFASVTAAVPQFREEAALYCATMALVMFQSLFPVWFFQGIERMKFIAYITLGARLLYVLGLFVFVRSDQDYVRVPALNAVGAALTIGAALTVIHGGLGVRLQRPNSREIFAVLREGRHACISQLAPNLYNNSSVFLLGLYASPLAVGIYSSATKLVDAANSFAYVLSNTFLPHLARTPTHHHKFAKLMLCMGTAATVFLIACADQIAALLFGAASLDIAYLVRWLAPGVLCVFVMLVYGTNFLMLVGRDRLQQNIALYTSFSFFIVALVTIPALGIPGAVLTLVGARLAMATATYIAYRQVCQHA